MNIGVVGLGLMGGSFSRTLVKQNIHKVYGFDIDSNALLKGEMLKAYNYVLSKNNTKDIDILILAVAPDKVESLLNEYVPLLKSGATIVDFCGIKRYVVNLMHNFSLKYPNINFIGGHPMAGREFSGIEHSTTTLFDNASMILVNVNADIFKLDEIKKFFLSVGFSNVEICSSDIHDSEIAFTSQLCHIVSNAFIKSKSAETHKGFSAGSYKDMTRVARLDAKMWANLMIENADYLENELDELLFHLTEYKKALNDRDKEKLTSLLSDGNERKLKIDCKTKKD